MGRPRTARAGERDVRPQQGGGASWPQHGGVDRRSADRTPPRPFAVGVEPADGAEEVRVFSPAVGGIHTPVEYGLSRAVLERLTDGGPTVGELLNWGREHAAGGTPRRAEREALLREWARA